MEEAPPKRRRRNDRGQDWAHFTTTLHHPILSTAGASDFTLSAPLSSDASDPPPLTPYAPAYMNDFAPTSFTQAASQDHTVWSHSYPVYNSSDHDAHLGAMMHAAPQQGFPVAQEEDSLYHHARAPQPPPTSYGYMPTTPSYLMEYPRPFSDNPSYSPAQSSFPSYVHQPPTVKSSHSSLAISRPPMALPQVSKPPSPRELLQEYEETLKKAMKAYSEHDLQAAMEHLIEASRRLLRNTGPMILYQDKLTGLDLPTENWRQDRKKLWSSFNNCWRGLLQKQRDASLRERDTRRPPTPPKSRLRLHDLDRIGSELHQLCEDLNDRKEGLIDYELNGIWEDIIMQELEQCLVIAESLDPPYDHRPSAKADSALLDGPRAPTRPSDAAVTHTALPPPPPPPGPESPRPAPAHTATGAAAKRRRDS